LFQIKERWFLECLTVYFLELKSAGFLNASLYIFWTKTGSQEHHPAAKLQELVVGSFSNWLQISKP
jgi:hypothetical protein